MIFLSSILIKKDHLCYFFWELYWQILNRLVYLDILRIWEYYTNCQSQRFFLEYFSWEISDKIMRMKGLILYKLYLYSFSQWFQKSFNTFWRRNYFYFGDKYLSHFICRTYCFYFPRSSSNFTSWAILTWKLEIQRLLLLYFFSFHVFLSHI